MSRANGTLRQVMEALNLGIFMITNERMIGDDMNEILIITQIGLYLHVDNLTATPTDNSKVFYCLGRRASHPQVPKTLL
jgi:hypothetical protein